MVADVFVAILAHNAQDTIGACLDSLIPYVRSVHVFVDGTTSDKTCTVAKNHGAVLHPNWKVKFAHVCENHGAIKVPHFGNARQATFQYAEGFDWYMWIDADDILQGGHLLEESLSRLAPDCAGLWMPYHYARVDNTGPVTTLFDRERVVRISQPWRWQYRVHEIIVPGDGRPTEMMNWARTDQIVVVHQGVGHDTHSSALRNITLLEIDLEENPRDMRALFYMGNQFFALGEWVKAAYFYGESIQTPNQYQVWQSFIYKSMAEEKMGQLREATQSAYAAIDIAPYHPEPYYRLAAMALLTGDAQRCEFWTRMGDQLPDPPNFAFRNPLDRTFNSRITLGNAYANAGMVSRARMEFEKAHAVVPSPVIAEGIANMRQLEEGTQEADAWVRVLKTKGVEQRDGIPDSVWKFGRVRDLVCPNIISHRPSTQPHMVIWCGQSAEPWSPVSLNSTGIGGSETAVIEIARRFQHDGWTVDIYNSPDHLEGEYDGVGYWSTTRPVSREVDVLVSWRNPNLELPLESHLSILWCHDLNFGPLPNGTLARWDRVLGVSQWHGEYLSQVYGCTATHVPNGINLERFASKVHKVPFRCVYASSPDRGLERLLAIWTSIHTQEPTAELHIAYGWETIDKYIQLGNTKLMGIRERLTRKIENSKGVVWRGRLPQNELAQLYQESYCLLYPGDFLEVSCISVMEAMAGGCVPVTSAAGALPETLGDGGLAVTGNVYTPSWRDYYTHIARGVLHSPEVRKEYAKKGQQRVRELTWDKSYECWKQLVVVKEATPA